MRAAIACFLTLSVLLGSASSAQAQAGRFVGRFIRLPRISRLPLPGGAGGRVPPIGGGARQFSPHIPIPIHSRQGHHGNDNGDGFRTFLIILGAIALALLGWSVGRTISRRLRGSAGKWPPFGPSRMRDLIRPPAEVAAKAEETRGLMELLASQDLALNPDALRQEIAALFVDVQKAWEARDYGPVRDRLMPGILTRHEGFLAAMRECHEINRIEDLRIERLEFVHLHCPQWPEDQEVTALITFRTRAYFIDDRTKCCTRGSRSPSWFQEFWIFRREGERWLLHAIEQSHQSDRLERANFLGALSEPQAENAPHGIAF